MKQAYLCLRTNEFQRCINCFSSLVTSTKSSSICNIMYSVILVFEVLRVVVFKLEQEANWNSSNISFFLRSFYFFTLIFFFRQLYQAGIRKRLKNI